MIMRSPLFCSYLLILLLAAIVPGLADGQEVSSPDTAIVVIKDPTQYSRAFIQKLKAFDYSSHYELRDSMLIIGRLDTAWFPTDLPLEKERILTGVKAGKEYRLAVRRISYTTVSYELKVFRSGKLYSAYKGLADLEPGFFLGAETDEDERTGSAYLSTEYYSRTNHCDLALRIGINDQSQLCARVKAGCADTAKNIALSDCPTLYSK